MLKTRAEAADRLVSWLRDRKVQNPSLGMVHPVQGGWDITTYGPARIRMANFFVGRNGNVVDKERRLG